MQKVPKLRELLYSLILFVFASSVSADEAKMKMGKDLFNGKAMCAGCHILKAAGAEGQIGPNLDGLKPTYAQVVDIVTGGLGVMPAFGEDGILTKAEIDSVSFYVAKSAGK